MFRFRLSYFYDHVCTMFKTRILLHFLPSEHCSCDALPKVSSIAHSRELRRLTQVVVVLKAVAKSHQAENQMPDC